MVAGSALFWICQPPSDSYVFLQLCLRDDDVGPSSATEGALAFVASVIKTAAPHTRLPSSHTPNRSAAIEWAAGRWRRSHPLCACLPTPPSPRPNGRRIADGFKHTPRPPDLPHPSPTPPQAGRQAQHGNAPPMTTTAPAAQRRTTADAAAISPPGEGGGGRRRRREPLVYTVEGAEGGATELHRLAPVPAPADAAAAPPASG